MNGRQTDGGGDAPIGASAEPSPYFEGQAPPAGWSSAPRQGPPEGQAPPDAEGGALWDVPFPWQGTDEIAGEASYYGTDAGPAGAYAGSDVPYGEVPYPALAAPVETPADVWTDAPGPGPVPLAAPGADAPEGSTAAAGSPKRRRLAVLSGAALVVATAVGFAVTGGSGGSASTGSGAPGSPTAPDAGNSTADAPTDAGDGGRQSGALGHGTADPHATGPSASASASPQTSAPPTRLTSGPSASVPATSAPGAPASAPAGRTPSASSSATAPTGGGTTSLTINGTWVLTPGQSVRTDRTTLAMQSDGDLQVLDQNGAVLWSAGTAGRGVRTVFQGDGNFVVYTADSDTAWQSGTSLHDGAVLVIGSDGNLVIQYGGAVIWQAGTAH